MRRLQVIRWALLAIFVPFVIFLVLQFSPKTPPTLQGQEPANENKAGSANQIIWSLLEGQFVRYKANVDLAEQSTDGSIILKGVEDLEIYREGESPLHLDASYGRVVGEAGNRIFSLSGGVVLRDEQNGFRFEVRELVLDEAKAEARSVGGVQVLSPKHNGRADQVVYGLDNQPTQLINILLTSTNGDRFEAQNATLHDGIQDVEFQGAVRLIHRGGRLEGERLRVWRNEDDQLERVIADGNIDGALPLEDGTEADIRANLMELRWQPSSADLVSIRLEGAASITRDKAQLRAETIECLKDDRVEGGWSVAASGNLSIDAPLRDEEARLDADQMVALVAATGDLLEAQATGNVRFASGATRAEADLIEILPESAQNKPQDRIILRALNDRPARLLQADARVRARMIKTDPAGDRLNASENVEITLLPNEGKENESSLFRADEALHFVADEMQSKNQGNQIELLGSVRGWQGSRTLSGKRIWMDQAEGILTAKENVVARLPRRSDQTALSESDFAEIRANELHYDQSENIAKFSGDTKILQDEGWLSASTVEVRLDDDGNIVQGEGNENVQFEYYATDDDGRPTKIIGKGDRFEYDPDQQKLTLHGIKRPASVERTTAAGGKTEGRTIIYNIEKESYEILSGNSDRVKINRTKPGGSP